MTAPPSGVSRHRAVEWCSFNRAALSNGTLPERPKQSFLCRFAFLLSFFLYLFCFNSVSLCHFSVRFLFCLPLLTFFSRFFPSRVTHNLPVFSRSSSASALALFSQLPKFIRRKGLEIINGPSALPPVASRRRRGGRGGYRERALQPDKLHATASARKFSERRR